jgi:hypothetical protein
MRVYPYWLYRYFLIAAAALFVVSEALAFIAGGFVPEPRTLVLVAVLVVFGLRALIGGVDASDTQYVVRTWFRTRRIPRENVVEITERSILSLTKDGEQRVAPLTWFGDSSRVLPSAQRHNAEAIEALRTWHASGSAPK